jgi:inhibitor of cysteine peptidase
MNKYLIGLVSLWLVGSTFIAGYTASATPSSQTVNAANKSASATTNAVKKADEMTSANAKQETQIVVAQGQVFTTWLRSNPSTGYRWQVNYDPNYVTLISQTFISDPHPPGKVGVGGYDLYIFTALKAGTTAIRFDNVSPAQQVVNTTLYTIIITL